mgnify:CR=1 FL=1
MNQFKMKKYKIGEVSKILDIPVETIRFYEKKGLIHPEKDKYSSYRYYDIWDISRLLDYRKYRELEFTLNESIDIIQSTDFEKYIDKLHQKQEEAEERSRYYELKAIKLHNYQNVLKNVPLLLGEYPIVRRPEGYYFINHSYDGENFYYHKAEDIKGFHEILKHYTFVENIYCIKKDWVNGAQKKEKFQWGFTIKKKWADALKISIHEEMEHITPVKSIYTIIRVKDEELFTAKLLEPVFSHMKAMGYSLNGDILGNQIATVYEDGERIRYMEIWVPILEEDKTI